MKKAINPYESGDSLRNSISLYDEVIDSDAIITVGRMKGSLRDLLHDVYLIDGQITIFSELIKLSFSRTEDV